MVLRRFWAAFPLTDLILGPGTINTEIKYAEGKFSGMIGIPDPAINVPVTGVKKSSKRLRS